MTVRQRTLDLREIKISLDVFFHQLEVTHLCHQFVEQRGIKCDKEILLIAASTHDLGKADPLTDPQILYKPGKYTEEEFGHMKVHSQLGAVLVTGRYPEAVAKVVRQHHENADGSGYPLGLTNDEIKLEARIINICDYYIANTSDRSYRKARTHIDTINLMKINKNEFDLRLLQEFFNMFDAEMEKVV